MKVYFLLGVFDQLFCDFIDVYNQEFSNDVIKAYGFAYAKKPCLMTDKFKELVIWSDLLDELEPVNIEFLKEIEQKAGMTIADLIYLDRHIIRFPAEQRLMVAYNLIKRFLGCMEKNKIEIVFSSGVADLISVFACQYAQRTGCFKFFCLMHSRFEDFYYFCDRIDNSPVGLEQCYLDHYQNISEQELSSVQEYWHNYVSAKKTPTYMKDKGVLFNFIRFADFKRLLGCFIDYYRDRRGLHYEHSPWVLPFYRLQRIYRVYRYKQLIKKRLVNPLHLPSPYKKYYIYPLHFHPESATLVLGRFLHDQVRIIEMISKALPADAALLVKEHSVSMGRRCVQFFKQIALFHNVFFVRENCDARELLKGSRGVFTISSTMGFEALLCGKPVFCIGEVFYSLSKGFNAITKIDQIADVIKMAEQNDFDQKSAFVLLKILLDSSFSLSMLTAQSYTKVQLQTLAVEFNKILVELALL